MALALQETRVRSTKVRRPLQSSAVVEAVFPAVSIAAASKAPSEEFRAPIGMVLQFSSAVDGRDPEALRSLLSADASWSGLAMQVPLEPLPTREEIVDWLIGFMHSQSDQGRHLVSDVQVVGHTGDAEVSDASRVAVTAGFTVTAAPRGAATRTTVGTYRFELRHESAGWRIHRIETEFDGPF